MDKSSQPLVSVCLASYNQSKYVIETLDSIHKQTYENIELIIVDDFSTDDSVSVIDEWLDVRGNRFTNYQFVKNLMNKGLCATFNSCITNSTGKYISIFASDDIMLEHKTERQVEILENTADDVAMVYSDCSFIKEDGSPCYGLFIQSCRQFTDVPSGKIFDDLILGNFIPAMSTLVKRSIVDRIGKFDEELKYEDWDFWLRISKYYQIIFSNFRVCKYRIHSKSLSHQTIWEIEDIQILKKYSIKPQIRTYTLPKHKTKNKTSSIEIIKIIINQT